LFKKLKSIEKQNIVPTIYFV